MKYFLVVMLMLTGLAEAGELGLTIYGKSFHFKNVLEHQKGFNETNPGVGLTYFEQAEKVGIPVKGEVGMGALAYFDSYWQYGQFVYVSYKRKVDIADDNYFFMHGRVGDLHGSGWNGIAFVPSVGVGTKLMSLPVEIEAVAIPPNIDGKIGVLGFGLNFLLGF